MKNYLYADFHRIMTKKSRIFLTFLLGIIDFIVVFMRARSAPNDIQATYEIGNFDVIYMIIIVMITIMISFQDDFRAKSMQAALGNGVKRHQIVLVKWFNLILISVLSLVFLTILEFIPLIILNRVSNSFVISQVLLNQLIIICTIAVTTALSLLVLFQTQTALLGVLAYAYLTMSITSILFFMAISNKLVQRFQLWNIDAADQMKTFLTKLSFGQFDIRNFLILAFYFALGIGGSIYLFRKKELDF